LLQQFSAELRLTLFAPYIISSGIPSNNTTLAPYLSLTSQMTNMPESISSFNHPMTFPSTLSQTMNLRALSTLDHYIQNELMVMGYGQTPTALAAPVAQPTLEGALLAAAVAGHLRAN
jgi:hypothetical protein